MKSGLVYKCLIYNQLVPLLNVILQMVVKDPVHSRCCIFSVFSPYLNQTFPEVLYFVLFAVNGISHQSKLFSSKEYCKFMHFIMNWLFHFCLFN